MCGILGQVNRRNEVDQRVFKKMLATLAKRGPDQSGIFVNRNLALGHQRLSIIDLSPAGKQPMFNENKNLSIIFNGEVYNFKNLKERLKRNHCFVSKTDTEVILHNYEEIGQEIVKKIEGMFAFAIYDQSRQLIILARDYFGKKPLYYFLDEDTFCFASELKAITANPRIKAKLKIDQLSLLKYLFYGFIPSPKTIFDKVRKLEPATTLQFDIRKWKIVNKFRYWSLENVASETSLSEGEILAKSEFLLEEAVGKRLMSDVPLGILLSGGIDSSLVAYYLGRKTKNLNSFTVCYKNSAESDELMYAQQVARKIGMKSNFCFLEGHKVKENFLEITDYLDEPLTDAALTPLYYISKVAKKEITVALSGDGGDEIFCGYPKYQAQQYIEKFKYLGFLAKILEKFFAEQKELFKLFKGFELPFFERQYLFGTGSFLPEEVDKLWKINPVNLEQVFDEVYYYVQKFRQNDTVNKSSYLDCKIQLPDWYLVKADRATMASSLELRSPFLDKELAEFVFSLRGNQKIKNGKLKYISRKICEKYFGSKIAWRKKSGFGVPMGKWIKEDLKELFEEYLFVNNDFFNQEFIKEIFKRHLLGKDDYRYKLLRIFNFNYWYKNYYGN